MIFSAAPILCTSACRLKFPVMIPMIFRGNDLVFPSFGFRHSILDAFPTVALFHNVLWAFPVHIFNSEQVVPILQSKPMAVFSTTKSVDLGGVLFRFNFFWQVVGNTVVKFDVNVRA